MQAQPSAVAIAITPAMQELVARLGSDDFAAREAAEEELSASTLRELESALGDQGLSLEQRERLERAGFARFQKQPRAALGVQFSQFNFGRGIQALPPAGGGVTIERTIPGFDAGRVFLPGDILRSMGGQPIRDQVEARPVIVSFEPGEEVPIEIVRNGQVVETTVRLGSFSDLDARNTQGLAPSQLERSWQYRLARAVGSQTPGPPEAAFDPARYRRVNGEERREKVAAARQARERMEANPLPDSTPFRLLNFVRSGTGRIMTEDARADFEPGEQRVPQKGQVGPAESLQQQVRRLESQVRENNLRLRNAKLQEDQRATLEVQNRHYLVQLQQTRNELRRIREQEKPNEKAEEKPNEGP